MTSAEELQKRLNAKIIEWFSPAGFCFDADAPIGALDQLDHCLSTRAPSSLVVLIDDYEAPLTEHLDDPTLFEKLQAVLREWSAHPCDFSRESSRPGFEEATYCKILSTRTERIP